mgnify:CR=1 FL=1
MSEYGKNEFSIENLKKKKKKKKKKKEKKKKKKREREKENNKKWKDGWNMKYKPKVQL